MTNLEIARNQLECHEKQVSGAWSINAQEFCEQTGIENLFEEAVEYQVNRELDDTGLYIEEQIAMHESALGSLTEDQIDHLRDNIGDCSNDPGYSSYFWFYVVRKLKEQGDK